MHRCSWSSPAVDWPCPVLHRGTDDREKHLTDRKGAPSNVIQINHTIVTRLGAALQQPLIPAEWNLFSYSLGERFPLGETAGCAAKVNPAAGQNQATRSKVRKWKGQTEPRKKWSDQYCWQQQILALFWLFSFDSIFISIFKRLCICYMKYYTYKVVIVFNHNKLLWLILDQPIWKKYIASIIDILLMYSTINEISL